MAPAVSNSHSRTAASSACPQWLWPPPRSGPREEVQGPVFWDHRLAAGLAERWGHFPTDLKIVWVNVTTVRQTARELGTEGERPPKGPAAWRPTSIWFGGGEGKAGNMYRSHLLLGLGTGRTPLPPLSPLLIPVLLIPAPHPSWAQAAVWPGGSKGKRARLVLQERICAALTAPPPGHLCPSLAGRSGMQATEEEGCGHCVVSLSSPHHPPRVSSQVQGLSVGEHSG